MRTIRYVIILRNTDGSSYNAVGRATNSLFITTSGPGYAIRVRDFVSRQ